MVNGNLRKGHAVVLGAGTMGSGIAALLAGIGWRVHMLDVGDVAHQALERLTQSGTFYQPDDAKRITPGNVERDLDCVATADWVVEAIIEQIEPKRALWREVAQRVNPDAVLSTNTSGLGIAEIAQALPEPLRKRFLGTHFFNPPRVMRLLELIPTDETDPDLTTAFTTFAERLLGKRVVLAKDRPGFITTRIGIYAMMQALVSAIRHGITPEEADLLLGPLVGRPRSGVFRLTDLVGLDIAHNIVHNQKERLPDDPYIQSLELPPLWYALIEQNRLGEKTGAGFYKREGKEIFTLDYATRDYRPRQEPNLPIDPGLSRASLPERLRALLHLPDRYGAFFREAFLLPLAYGAEVMPDVAYDIPSMDMAMRLGYNWELGVFETWDALGEAGREALAQLNLPHEPSTLRMLRNAELKTFYTTRGASRYYFEPRDEQGDYAPLLTPPFFIQLDDLAAGGKVIAETPECRVIDLGDDVACVEFRTKANVLTPSLMEFVAEFLQRAERNHVGVVIGNQGRMFSAGFNLNLFVEYITKQDWQGLDRGLQLLQGLSQRIRYCGVPVVAAVHGYALGGGLEVVLPCAHVHAHVDTGIGLPEAAVGLMPAGGGTTLMTRRALQHLPPEADPVPHLRQPFLTLAYGKRSTNAFEAYRLGFLRERDTLCWNLDRLLYEAKQHVLALSRAGYRPPEPTPILAVGVNGYSRLMMEVHWMHQAGQITDHDRLIAEKIAYVMTGGDLRDATPLPEEHFHTLEREVFIELCKSEKTLERIKHMLETGKPLRN
ncbi:MAG: 3-hydroxyacyl-CoA dehydrogenase/enoyl-CoA hydratase family protein [Fimbriimonadales bacterium]|nr:3-hydroxyacyl-CoA dehydrogenase/enoyl-CoA hydratase family protein [Fimbriimonadales bacterium]